MTKIGVEDLLSLRAWKKCSKDLAQHMAALSGCQADLSIF